MLDILKIGNPLLRQRAREVSPEELSAPETQRFIDDLIDTMRAASGAGLAATQVGTMLRICTVEVRDNPRYPYKPNIPLTILVNPVLEPVDGETFDNYEGCLSVPNLRGLVPRATRVRVRAVDRHGAPVDEVVAGLKAGTYQHEVDHLDGVLFVDRVKDTRSLTTWDEFERHHRETFVARARDLVARFGS